MAIQPPGMGRVKQDAQSAMNVVGPELSRISRRLSLIENKMDGMQDHISLVDNNLIEKHKTAIGDIREMQSEVRSLQAQVAELSEFLKRIAGKMSDFASRDDFQVIEKYMDYWSPLAFTTKQEVENMIKAHLGEKESVSKEDVSTMVAAHVAKHNPVTKKDVAAMVTANSKSLSKKDVKDLVSAEVGKIKISGNKNMSKADIAALVKAELKGIPKTTKSNSLTKKEVEAIVAKHMQAVPVSKGSGVSLAEIKKITRQQIEDLFGKL